MTHVAHSVPAGMLEGTVVEWEEKPALYSVQPTAPPATSSSSEAG